MGPPNSHKKFGVPRVHAQVHHGLQSFDLHSTGGQKIKVLRILPNLVGKYLWVVECHKCILAAVAQKGTPTPTDFILAKIGPKIIGPGPALTHRQY